MVLKLEYVSNIWIVQTQGAETQPGVSDSVHLGQGQRFGISNKGPGDNAALVQGSHLGDHLFKHGSWHVVRTLESLLSFTFIQPLT